MEVKDRKKRDRYSYNELAPGLTRLGELAGQFVHVEAKEQTAVQRQIVQLDSNVALFEALTSYLDFARGEYPIDASPAVAAIFAGGSRRSLSTVLSHAAEISALFHKLNHEAGANTLSATDREELDRLWRTTANASMRTRVLALFPPTVPVRDSKEWQSPADMADRAFSPEGVASESLRLLSLLEEMVAARNEPAAFREKLEAFHAGTTALAEARGESDKVRLELTYYKAGFFHWSQMFFVLTFVLGALIWMKPASRWLYRITWLLLFPPTLLLVAGITVRCIIRDRPPVTTLYETILFVTACVVIAAMIIEWINRQRIAISLAAVLGLGGLFLANKYERLAWCGT
ncbi:MAG: hypothetical protein AB1486_02965 [Planctomycetota bacterium]